MSTARSYVDQLDLEPRHPGRRMTEKEFVDWCTSDTWAEWVDGEVILMSPVDFANADIAAFLLRLIGGFVEDRELGKVVTEPFQLRFAKLRRRRSPDIIYISNARLAQLQKYHLEGPADLIVEVVSAWSQSRDRREKFLEYQSVGVGEYWIVDPAWKSVEAYALGRSRKYAPIDERNGAIHSVILDGFYLRPEWLWRESFPKVSSLLRHFRRKR